MIVEGQLAQSVGSAQSQTVPPGLLPTGLTARANLLGNAAIQVFQTSSLEGGSLMDAYRILFAAAPTSSRLAVIKREKFTHEGKEDRIQKSLAALNAPQPTDLPLAKWKA